jgi:hypothetical protein
MLVMTVLLVVPVVFEVLALRDRIRRDRLEHGEPLLQRLVRQRCPLDVIQRKLRVRNPVEQIAKEG